LRPPPESRYVSPRKSTFAPRFWRRLGLPHDEFDYSKNIFGATPPHKFGYYCFSDGFGVIDADGETVYDNTGETVLSQTGPQSERLEWGKAMLQTTYEDIGRR